MRSSAAASGQHRPSAWARSPAVSVAGEIMLALAGAAVRAAMSGKAGMRQAERVASAGDEPVNLGELGLPGREADLQALGLAEPEPLAGPR